MNGPDHYRKAEELLDHVSGEFNGNMANTEMQAYQALFLMQRLRFLVGAAQVHATLAQVAAIAGLDAHEGPGGGSATGRTGLDVAGWDVVLGGPR